MMRTRRFTDLGRLNRVFQSRAQAARMKLPDRILIDEERHFLVAQRNRSCGIPRENRRPSARAATIQDSRVRRAVRDISSVTPFATQRIFVNQHGAYLRRC